MAPQAIESELDQATGNTHRHCIVRVRHEGNPEVFVVGDFNNWRLPGVPMERRDGHIWESIVPLAEAGARRVACFLLDGIGFRRVPCLVTECEVRNQ